MIPPLEKSHSLLRMAFFWQGQKDLRTLTLRGSLVCVGALGVAQSLNNFVASAPKLKGFAFFKPLTKNKKADNLRCRLFCFCDTTTK